MNMDPKHCKEPFKIYCSVVDSSVAELEPEPKFDGGSDSTQKG